MNSFYNLNLVEEIPERINYYSNLFQSIEKYNKFLIEIFEI